MLCLLRRRALRLWLRPLPQQRPQTLAGGIAGGRTRQLCASVLPREEKAGRGGEEEAEGDGELPEPTEEELAGMSVQELDARMRERFAAHWRSVSVPRGGEVEVEVEGMIDDEGEDEDGGEGTRRRKGKAKDRRRRLDVCIMGAPNAGKSALLNTLVGRKIAGISRKRHATQREIVAAFQEGEVQVLVKDTPGFLPADEAYADRQKTLSETAMTAAQGVDAVLLAVDAARKLGDREMRRYEQTLRLALERVEPAQGEVILVLTKCDLVVPRTRLLEITTDLAEKYNDVKYGKDVRDALDMTVFMTSSTIDRGIDELREYLLLSARENKNWALESGQVTTLTEEEQVVEIVREDMFNWLHEEIPYETECQTCKIEHITRYRTRVDVELIVPRAHFKKTLLSAHAKRLRQVQEASARKLSSMFNKEVSLFLWVRYPHESLDSIMDRFRAHTEKGDADSDGDSDADEENGSPDSLPSSQPPSQQGSASIG